MENQIVEIYERYYDDPTKSPENLLGDFEVLQNIDIIGDWDNNFFGRNINTNEICYIKGCEIKGLNGGISYEVIKLKPEVYRNKSKLPIITLIGSGKFINDFKRISNELTLKGNIVFTPAIFDDPNFFTDPSKITKESHEMYDKIHREKMNISDSILVINPNGYIGHDTNEEIQYALSNNIVVQYLDKSGR